MSKLEEALALQIKAVKLPEPEREYRFAAIATGGIGSGVRKRLKDAGLKDWRMDYAWPDLMLAVEVEGGGFINGRHNRGVGFAEDLRKYSEAMSMGWTLYRCDALLIKSGKALQVIEKLIKARQESE